MCLQERIDRHGQVSPPVGEDKIDRVIILNSLFISLQKRSEAFVLLLLCLVDRFIVICRIGFLCQDLHRFAACFLRNPRRDLTGISHKTIVIDPNTCAGIRVKPLREIRVSDSAEIDCQGIALGSRGFCFRSCCRSRVIFSDCTFHFCASLHSLLRRSGLFRFFCCYFFLLVQTFCYLCICRGLLRHLRVLSGCRRAASACGEPEK